MKPKLSQLKNALLQMDPEFTSYEFSKSVKELYPEINEKFQSSKFLHKHAEQLTAKTWKKKGESIEDAPSDSMVRDYGKMLKEDKHFGFLPTLRNEQTAIKFLKSLGYKILKPISEYKEV